MKMRPYISAALLALALGTTALSPSSSPGQVQLETQRKILSKVTRRIQSSPRKCKSVEPSGWRPQLRPTETEVDSSAWWPSAVGKSRGRCHRKMEMGTGSGENQRTHRTQFSSLGAQRLKCLRVLRASAVKPHSSHAAACPNPLFKSAASS